MTDSDKDACCAGLLRTHHGIPLASRSETVEVLDTLCSKSYRDSLTNVYGAGPHVLSNIPEHCRFSQEGVVLGIDEAGRGSVVGPMTYGMSFWHATADKEIPADFNDSKKLSEDQRECLFEKILTNPAIGFCVRVLHASEISRNMLRPEPYNLNAMSHDAAISMIRSLKNTGVSIRTCYIDTVGNADSYRRRLESEFPHTEFIVESKADDNYAPCSAASIVAKVIRDRMIANWNFSEPAFQDLSTKFGSGYPSDPTCKAWLEENQSNGIFGFPDAVRFSWGPVKKQLAAKGTVVKFAGDDSSDGDEENKHKIQVVAKRQQESMSAFLSGTSKRKRLGYFHRRHLATLDKL